MTLLSPLFLLFGLAAAVPLVLHLYQRRNRTVMLFSSNRFFNQSIVRSQRRLRLRRLLLLLMRIAACVFIALAAAQPVLNLFGLGGNAGNRDVVVLLDDSLSMSEVPHAKFPHARRLAADLLAQLGGGDRAAVFTFTGQALGSETRQGVELTTDTARLANQARQLQPSQAAGDPEGALAQLARLFAGSRQRHRLLIVLSDFQASDWRDQPWPQPPQPVDTLLVNLGPPSQDNVCLESLRLAQGLAVVDQPNVVTLRLINYRPAAVTLPLVVTLDGQEQARRNVAIPAQSPHIEHVPLVFDRPGDHRLIARIDSPDALPDDNTFYAAVHVIRDLPVLVVDGQAKTDGLPERQSPAYFLRAALLAAGPAGERNQSLRPDVIKPADLLPNRLDNYRVAFLCNVRELSLDQLDRLEKFVLAGGGLGIFLGDQADLAFYNDVLGATSRPLGGLMPVKIDALVNPAQLGLADQSLHVLAAELEHPLFERFQGPLRSALASISIYRAYQVEAGDLWVIAALDRNLPLLVEHAYGGGRVMLMSTAPTPAWTNLPLRRAFIPLLTRLTSYLAGGGMAAQTVDVGQELTVLHGGWDTSQPVQVRMPDNTMITAAVRAAGAAPVAFLPAQAVTQPGFYALMPQGPVKKVAATTSATLLAVNVPRSESIPAKLDIPLAPQLTGLWKIHPLDLSASNDAAEVTALLTSPRTSRGIWDVLLWTVLALVLLEPLVADWLFRSGTGGFNAASRAGFAEQERDPFGLPLNKDRL